MASQKLRMTPAIMHLLLSLAEGESHGYALLSDMDRRSRGAVNLGPSSLYYTLGRLADHGLIEEAEGPGASDEPHAEQRRYFRMTDVGREWLESELGVLTDIVDQARALGLRAEH
ncbi:MAG: PadR family transcriptional regulator [Acidobacteria bacterium]|nr:PadR family transcriptional regulator [Acidobacteriota bacterium]